MPAHVLPHEFTCYACDKLTQHLAQIARCASLLDDEQVWHRANEHCNSVGNLILHLTGNVRQWVIAGLAGEPFNRDRPAEFAQRGPLPTAEILSNLESVVGRASEIIRGLDVAALTARRTIQGYDVSGVAAVFHIVEHFSGHAAQIVHMTKALKDVDVSLYDAQGHKRPGAGAAP
jgi:uncharacterized damage-inducible protein DinB